MLVVARRPWEGSQFFRVVYLVHVGEHLSELIYGIGRNASANVLRVEPLEALVDEVPNLHP